MAAFYYEYARASPVVSQKIQSWTNGRSSPRQTILDQIAKELSKRALKFVRGDLIEVFLISDPWDKVTELRPKPHRRPPFPPHFLATFPEFPSEPWYSVPSSPQKNFWIQALNTPNPDAFDLSSFLLRTEKTESHTDIEEGPIQVPEEVEKEIIHDALKDFSDQGFEIFAFACDLGVLSDKELIKIFTAALKERRKSKPTLRSAKMHRQQRHYTGRKLPFEPHRALRWLNLLRVVTASNGQQKTVAVTRPSQKQNPSAWAQIGATAREVNQARKIISWFSGKCDTPKFVRTSRR